MCVTMDQCENHYVSPYFVVSIYLPTPKTKMILEVTQIKKIDFRSAQKCPDNFLSPKIFIFL